MSTAPWLQNFWDLAHATVPIDADPPDDWIAALVADGRIRGTVLDAGCGPGSNARYLAGLGFPVLGVDLSAIAVEHAARRAAEAGNKAHFLQSDICHLCGYENRFDTVLDIGCFQSLHPADRPAYVAALHRLCRPGAVVFLRVFHGEPFQSHFVTNGWDINFVAGRELNPFTPWSFAEIHYA